MNNEIKREWVKALRSGDYKQGIGLLCNARGEMCCLGVLFDTSADDYWVWAHGTWRAGVDGSVSHYGVDAGLLTVEEQVECTEMNDADRCSFNEIADWVEENL